MIPLQVEASCCGGILKHFDPEEIETQGGSTTLFDLYWIWLFVIFTF